jgi:hypothetical protein
MAMLSQGISDRIVSPRNGNHPLEPKSHAVPSFTWMPTYPKIADPTTSSRTLESHELTLWRHPIQTIQYFVLAVYEALPKQWPFSVTSTTSIVVVTAASLSFHLYGKSGWLDSSESSTIQDICRWLEISVAETLFWIGCGVLSTIGLGSGVQTGALFLFPHVCRLALAWSKEQQQDDKLQAPSLVALLWSVAIPGFWSGGGSAAGELVPFLLARVIRQSGKDPFDLLNVLDGNPPPRSFDRDDVRSAPSRVGSQDSLSSADSMSDQDSFDESSERSRSIWTPRLLLSNTRVAMESQLSTNTFWKIFALAVVPNALFDLAGLVCGASSDVTWLQFFSATWMAKALVRTPAQTCGLALAVVAIASPSSLASGSSENLDRQDLTRAAAAASSSTTTAVSDFFERWGRMALAEFVGDEEFMPDKVSSEGDPSQAADLSFVFVVVKALWSLMTFAMLAFFLISTVEQVAQHYVRTKTIVATTSRDVNGADSMSKKRT